MFAAAYGIPQFSGDDLASGDENLRALADHAALNHTQAMEKILRVGSPAREICEAAKESGADLLVLGSHGSTGWRYFCIGSTAEHVVRAAPCSVLVVREKEHDFGTGAVAPH
jgi:nucleotide-binding universal stress UspA family protein